MGYWPDQILQGAFQKVNFCSINILKTKSLFVLKSNLFDIY